MTDLISRADAVKTVIRKCSPICAWQVGTQQYPDCVVAEINALPSAELTLETPQTYGKSINPSNAEVVEDLISRADAIKAVASITMSIHLSDVICDKLLALPSADAVQGEWKHTITAQPYCSNCEYVFGEDEEFSPFWNYCPMCGARMKGGEDE